MKVLICGDRHWDKPLPIDVVVGGLVRVYGQPITVIEGGARGADTMAGMAAKAHGCGLEVFRAKWDELGKRAGLVRNQQMLDEGEPELVIAFHNDLPNSKGTADMVRRAKKVGVPVYLVSRA